MTDYTVEQFWVTDGLPGFSESEVTASEFDFLERLSQEVRKRAEDEAERLFFDPEVWER